MHSFLRTLLFAFFVALFVVGAPAVVLYTAGYRFNAQNGQLVRTGVLAVSSTPRGATVLWGNNVTGEVTPFVFNRVMPSTYTLRISKNDYHGVSRKVSVESGKTTYLNDVLLFPDVPPALLITETADIVAPSQNGNSLAILRQVKNAAEIWLYDIASNSYTNIAQFSEIEDRITAMFWSGDGHIIVTDINGIPVHAFGTDGSELDPTHLQDDDAIKLVDNGQAIEVINNGTLIALLPSGVYTVAETDGSYVVIRNARDDLYLFDMASNDPLLLSTTGTMYNWNRSLDRFVWSDGIEVNAFDASSRNTTFITRQSTPIIGASWYATSSSILAATQNGLTALTIEDGVTEDAITLADGMSIRNFWTDESGHYAYLYGTLDDVKGLYRLQLK